MVMIVRIISGVFYFDIIPMLAVFARTTANLVADKTGSSLHFLSLLNPLSLREVTVSALHITYPHRFTPAAIRNGYVSVRRALARPPNSATNIEYYSNTFIEVVCLGF